LYRWINGKKTVNVMARIFRAPAGFIVQYLPQGYQVLIASNQETNPYPAGVEISPETNIFCKKVVHDRKTLYVNHAQTDRYWDTNPEVVNDGFSSYLGLPLFWPSGEPFGTICVMDYQPTEYQSEYVDLMAELKDLIEADLEMLTQFQDISSLAMTDELTGLYNRRGFNTVATHFRVLARRSGTRVGLLYLDLDGLKDINDQYGHSAGDAALMALAESIRESIRESDIPARMSGDEFVVLVAAKTQDDMDSLVLRIRDSMQKKQLSVSAGGVLISNEHSLEHWLSEADKKMYSDKKGL
jgi:diguanylate cyclase (GGDEF)-like protein